MDAIIRFNLTFFLDLKVTVKYESSPNTYTVQVNNGDWRRVEAYLQNSPLGLRLNAAIEDKRSNVGLLTHENQVHVYDEVSLKLSMSAGY